MTSGYLQIHGWCDYEDIYSEAAREVAPHGILVEVGSLHGRSIAYMAEQIRNKPGVKLYAVDIWGDREHDERGQLGTFMRNMVMNVPAHDLDAIHPIRVPSAMAARMFDDKSVDFVFLDDDHRYAGVKASIEAWAPKIKPGGVLAGHDIVHHEWGEPVSRAVREAFGDDFKIRRTSWWRRMP